jgi:hypothetical protein
MQYMYCVVYLCMVLEHYVRNFESMRVLFKRNDMLNLSFHLVWQIVIFRIFSSFIGTLARYTAAAAAAAKQKLPDFGAALPAGCYK